jgi:adenylosuccinate lyase
MTAPNLALPGNPRYQPKQLLPYFGYDNNFRFVAEVEIATMKTLGEIGVIPAEEIALLSPELETGLLSITTTQVDERERKVTKHDIRAWVQLAQEMMPPQLRRWVHVPLTSYDALDTARTLQFLQAHEKVVRPLVAELVGIIAEKARHHATMIQIGRTHGQHALPITVGFWLATLLNRIVWNAQEMDRFAEALRGKISGAVGAYNAQVGLGIAEICGDETFEERVLKKIGLQPGLISTQILPPEPLAYYLYSATALSAALGQFGRDGRSLMRTEIGEISEPFAKGQVGSSTMAHKRNPINFENSEGMWLKTKCEFGKVFETLISDHQRDLVGSCISRDFPTIIVNLVTQLNTFLRKNDDGDAFAKRITIDDEACLRNFEMQKNHVMAEPVYIALQMAGYPGDAHEIVNRKAVPFIRDDMTLVGAIKVLAKEDSALDEALGRIPVEVIHLLESPHEYIGLAVQKTEAVCTAAEDYCRAGLHAES